MRPRWSRLSTVRVATSLTPQGRQQSLADIGTDLASAQVAMKDITSRQNQSQLMLQNLVDQTETVSSDQVATEIFGAADQIAGIISNHIDALAADAREVPADRIVRALRRTPDPGRSGRGFAAALSLTNSGLIAAASLS